MGNLGNIQYVLLAVIGGLLGVTGFAGGVSLGSIAAFLHLSRSFNMPINLLSQQ